MRIVGIFGVFVLGVMVFSTLACGHRPPLILADENSAQYRLAGTGETLIERHAPVFRVADYRQPFNRIGKPTATLGDHGEEIIFVDTAEAVVYTDQRSFQTDRGKYLNLIYRIHFPEVPYQLIPFHLTAGKNGGLLIVVTLDAQEKPVLLTTVHTCGCYAAVIPTTYLPTSARPAEWPETFVDVYGERLPALLDYEGKAHARPVLYIRPAEHRIADIKVMAQDQLASYKGTVIPLTRLPRQRLNALPINGGSTSFFHESGMLKGHVKGAIKPWEMLFMSVISLDLFVGSDKAYQDKAVTGNPFYTSLKPWNRDRSDMYFFDRFLAFWGWRL